MEKNTYKDQRKNRRNDTQTGQPEPMSGSKKVKQKNHVSQTAGEGS